MRITSVHYQLFVIYMIVMAWSGDMQCVPLRVNRVLHLGARNSVPPQCQDAVIELRLRYHARFLKGEESTV